MIEQLYQYTAVVESEQIGMLILLFCSGFLLFKVTKAKNIESSMSKIESTKSADPKSFAQFVTNSAYLELEEENDYGYIVKFHNDTTFEITNYVMEMAHNYGYEVYGMAGYYVAFTSDAHSSPYPTEQTEEPKSNWQKLLGK